MRKIITVCADKKQRDPKEPLKIRGSKLFALRVSVVPLYADESPKDKICILLYSLVLLVDNFIDKQKPPEFSGGF